MVYPNGEVRACLVEIDMGTLTLRRFGRKVQAFEAAFDVGVFQRNFPNREEVEVLVLTSSRRRLQALRQVAARTGHGSGRDLWYFATFEALDPTAFARAERVDLDGRTVSGVLYCVASDDAREDVLTNGRRCGWDRDAHVGPASRPPRRKPAGKWTRSPSLAIRAR